MVEKKMVGRKVANRLREVVFDGTWIANTNFKDQLEGLDFKVAVSKIQSLNTIAQLAQHIHYYIEGINNVFVNGKLEISDRFSFDFQTFESQTDWDEFLIKFWNQTEKLAVFIESMSDDKLNGVFVDKKYGSYLRNMDGMIEHCYYHLGQIVLIKKMLDF